MLKNLTVVELKSKCKSKGLKGYSNKCKTDLIHLLQNKSMKGGGLFKAPDDFWDNIRTISESSYNSYFKFAYIIDNYNTKLDQELVKGAKFTLDNNYYVVIKVDTTKDYGFLEKVITAERR